METQLQAIRKRMRRFNAVSIAERALRELHAPSKSNQQMLESAPWISILIVKWALQDNRIPLRDGPDISDPAFERLRQDLWDLQGQANIVYSTRPALLLRHLATVQMEFQRQLDVGVMRWPALIDSLPKTHDMRSLLSDAIRMTPRALAAHALAVLAADNESRAGKPMDFFRSFKEAYGDATTRFFELAARDYQSLRSSLQATEHRVTDGLAEFFHSPFLRRFPLLRRDNGEIVSWHPAVLARGMEEFIHLRLSESGERYTQVFSKVFEDHVLAQLDAAGVAYIGERELYRNFGGDAASVEAFIECGNCNILIEAKMGKFWDSVMASDSPEDAFRKAKGVRKALAQGIRVSSRIRAQAAHFPNAAKQEKDYLLVVTSRELHLSGGRLMRQLFPQDFHEDIYPEDRQARVSFSQAPHLIPERVFVVSINDFEKLMGMVADGRVDLQETLELACAANADPSTSKLYFSDHLERFAEAGWPVPKLISDFRDAVHEEIRVKVFGGGL